MDLIARNRIFDVEPFFSDFFSSPGFPRWMDFPRGSEITNLLPRTDIEEEKDSYVIKTDLPGVKKEEINLTLQNGVLTIEAEHKHETEKKDGKYVRKERSEGHYTRSFSVDKSLTEKDIHADYCDGVLCLTIPRKEEQLIEKTIKIN